MLVLSRRQLLRAVPAAAAAAAAPSLLGPPTSATAAEPRFPGDPGDGRVYYGAFLPWPQSLSAWEDGVLGRTVSTHRGYFQAGDPAGVVGTAREDHARSRLPMLSIRPPGDWAAVARGAHDAWVAQILEGLALLGHPVLLIVHHEPENDAGGGGMSALDYNQMQQRLLRMAAQLTDNVTVVPVLQHWTFDPRRDDASPEQWTVEGAPVFGVDLYNPWSASNGLDWRSMAEKLDEVRVWSGTSPIAISEYGCRHYPPDPQRSYRWMIEAMDYARHHEVVAMAYFNSNNSRHESWVLDRERLSAFKQNLHDSSNARI